MPVSEETFKRISLEDPDGRWELDGGCLRQKPEMTFEHNQAQVMIGRGLLAQLDPRAFVVRIDNSLVRRSASRFYIPDVMVVALETARRLFPNPGMWEVYPEPVLLVVEVWSPSTGRYDLTRKLSQYQRRGDAEIWLLHPYEETLRTWQRQPDGRYAEAIHRGGIVKPIALPNVSIDLGEIFDLLR
jgi:Uma2 family endonuclease